MSDVNWTAVAARFGPPADKWGIRTTADQHGAVAVHCPRSEIGRVRDALAAAGLLVLGTSHHLAGWPGDTVVMVLESTDAGRVAGVLRSVAPPDAPA